MRGRGRLGIALQLAAVSDGASSLDFIVPGLYGSKDPLTFWLAPLERARVDGLPTDEAALRRMVDAQTKQLAREFPGVPVQVLEQ